MIESGSKFKLLLRATRLRGEEPYWKFRLLVAYCWFCVLNCCGYISELAGSHNLSIEFCLAVFVPGTNGLVVDEYVGENFCVENDCCGGEYPFGGGENLYDAEEAENIGRADCPLKSEV